MNTVLDRTKSLIRRGVLRVLTAGPVPALWSPLRGARATILMFHRFGGAASWEEGPSPEVFRRSLRYLRKHRYQLIDLEDLVRSLSGGQPLPRRAVAITFDDGYHDHFDVALPILAEFDAPATFFLTTGFADGTLWLWWDQVEFLLTETDRPRIELAIAHDQLRYAISTEPQRRAAVRDLTERCKRVSNDERLAVIGRLEAVTNRELPSSPPARYRPMTWEQARIAERYGTRFGPSTVSHPVLSRVDDATAAYEIEHSWKRVQEETTRPLPVFCYPNGLVSDFGDREIGILSRIGMAGAVTAEPGHLLGKERVFALPRLGGPSTLPQLVRIVSGLQVLLTAMTG